MKNLNLFEKCNRRIAKRVTLVAVLLAMCIPEMWADTGYYEEGGNVIQLVFVKDGAGDPGWWANTGNTQSTPVDIGTVNSSLYLDWFKVYVWKKDQDIQWTDLYYRIYPEGGTAPDFSNYRGYYLQGKGGNNCQYGNNTDMSVNCFGSGVVPGQSYIVEYYVNTDNVGYKSNQGGSYSNYKCRFTVPQRYLAADFTSSTWSNTAYPMTNGSITIPDIAGNTTCKFALTQYNTWDGKVYWNVGTGSTNPGGNVTLSDDGSNNHNIKFTTPSGYRSDVTISYDGNQVSVSCARRWTVTYSNRGAKSGHNTAPTDANTYSNGTTFTIKDNTYLMWSNTDGEVFAGWATTTANADAKIVDYQPGATPEITSDLTLYPVWTDGAYLFELKGSSSSSDINTNDFEIDADQDKTAYAVNDVIFSKTAAKFKNIASPAPIKGQTYSNKFWIYDATHKTTKIRIYAKNTSSTDYVLSYNIFREGEAAIADKTETIKASSSKMIVVDASSTKGARLVLAATNKAVVITQIVVAETGDVLPKVGETGYELAFPGRAVSTAKINGNIVINPTTALKFGENPNLQIKKDKYLKFTTTAVKQIQVTTNNSQNIRISNSDASEGGETFGGSKSTHNRTVAAGTWYIAGSTTTALEITKIKFADAPTITYNANGGSNTMSTSAGVVSANGFTAPSGKLFVEWNTASGGGGDSYDPGDLAHSAITLYAQWGYALTYDKNTTDAVTNMPTSPVGVKAGSTNLASEVPVRSGYIFVGWQVGGAGTIYQPGGSYTMPSSVVTMKAKWVAENMTITDARKSSSWGSDKTAGNEITSTNIKGTISGGTVVCSNSDGTLGGNGDYGLVFDNNNDQITITVTGKTFSEGSVIVLEGYSVNTKSVAVGFTASSNAFIQGNYTTTAAEYQKFRRTYIVSSGDGIINTSSFTLSRSTNNKVYLYSLQVGGCEEPSCTTPTIAWSTSPTNGNVGGNMTISVTSNYPAGVTITSNNSNATLTDHTVDGSTVSYTLNYAVAGNANITASVDGDGSTVCDETVNLDAVAITVSKNTPTQYAVTIDNATVCSGSSTNIKMASSQSGVSYRLYKGEDAVSESKAGGSALTWSSISATGTYKVMAVEDDTYASREMSNTVTLANYDAVSIKTHPTSAIDATVGEGADMSVVLNTGTYNNAAYHWQTCTDATPTSATDITSGSQYANYDEATMTFTPSSAGTYYFRCKVTDDCGTTVYSNVVTVTVSACSPTTLVKTVITGYSASKFQKTTTGSNAGTPIIDLKSDATQSANIDGVDGNETGYKMTDGKKFYVQLSGTTLKAGDIIRVGITKANDTYIDPATSKKTVLILCAWDGSTVGDSIGKITDVSGAGIYSYTVKAPDLTRCEGANDTIHYVGLARNRWDQNPFMHSIEIVRPCAETTYELTWNTNGGSELVCTGTCTSGDLAPGTTLVAPTDPTLSNYTFDGWKTANDGTGSVAAATMPENDVTYYAAWKQTVTLKTGAQGSGADKTPYVYINGATLNGFSEHTATGYTLNGYYTAATGGTKVLNADGTFAGTDVTNYITGSKWSRTDATTLYAQWRAAGGASCNTIDHISDFPSSGSTGMTVGNLKVTYSGDKVSRTTATIYSGKTGCNVLKIGGSGTGQYVQGYLGGNEISSLELGVEGENSKAATPYCVAFSASSTFDDESVLSWSALNSQKNTNTSSATSDTLTSITVPSGAKYFRIYRKASFNSTELGAGSSVYVWHIKACTAGASTHEISYDAGGGSGSMSSNTGITDDGSRTLTSNSFTAPTNYSFAGWVADVNVTIGGSTVTAGTLIANGATITNITVDIALTAKWSQTITLDANTSNHGSGDNGSATAYYNATSLSSVTHTKAATGYKLSGYYTEATSGTKVLNADGSFASANVTDWISSGKWICVASTRTLYAQYESAGALTWNLIVNSDTTALSTSTKTSAFTEISTTNMTNAALTGLTYDGSTKKSSLTGKISTPASYDADKYVYVTFQVASGYKFTPSMIQVPVQPVGNGEDKAVVLRLTDNTHSLVSGSATRCEGTEKGKKTTVTLAGDETYFTGTVTLKIYVYDFSSSATGTYRLGTPITIEGEIEEACATMPSYKSMSYTTTTFAPGADASGSPITIVGGNNINTYQWKYNTVNDRTSGTNCGTGTSLTPLTNEGAAADVTRYYWCEMTNDACGITIKSPAVAITVAAAKSDATVAWTNPESTPNYGGGGYTIKATVETGWDGNAADLVITAPAGINIYNVSSGTDGSSRKYVQADFDVQTSFDRTTYASNIPFTVSAAATASYNAISNDRNVSYSACTGAGEGSSYNIRMRKTVTKDGNYYHCANTDGWISPNISSSYSTGKAGTKMETDFDTVASSNTQYVWVRTYHANVNKVRIYADFRANDMTVSNVYKHTAYFSADSKYAVDYTAVYNDDEENENTGTAAQGYVDITLDEVMAANDILLVKFNDSKVRPLGAVITEGSAGSLNTHLQWSGGLLDDETVDKHTTDAYFTYSASKITENTNTLGAITYSSSDPSVATVDATGKVALIAAGETTIKATLAASGCYKKAEISYTLNVEEVACAITAGTLTLTSGTESKCSSDNVTLTLTGFESDASIQWKDGDTDINNGGNYTIETDGTTSTLTTNQEGTYSVMVTKDCSVRSNRITISNKSTEVGAKRIVKNWYIKNGRPTPDIELWTLQNGAHLSSVAWSSTNTTGLADSDFYESDGKVYLKGKEPSSNTSGADINYTLTLTVEDDCGSTTAMSASDQLIYLHHQKNTDKHVLAFVVNGTDKGGFTEGITAEQTTGVELYNTIAANFDVLATNVYSTDDEQALKEYYSQFDILCVTDYPNTGTKGVNKKSYVDALGALVDIRPILTMEAFVAKLANWKAKGISGTPQSPTTRQYTMLLQCKDHEIFSGTKLTMVGEGDETMYRVSMVCDTLEDYKTLDATYGEGAHAEKSGYEYGSKPALQGFTFTKEMLDDDLLPLGLIDDGSGNDLQVGIERQTEMEARLMVLGINSYAMERLTDDGQTVVVNALKYLMKKNSEDIADCSNTFVGGDDEEDVSTRYNWDVASHWSGNAVPDRTQKVRIVAPCVIPANVKPHVAGVIIAPSGKYNHGANTASGSLTIAAGGALIVDGKVEAATAPNYYTTRATTPTDLVLQSNSSAQAALILDNSKGETQATVEMYSPSHWEVQAGTNKKKSYWSYVGVPITDVNIGEYFYGAVTYLYDETSGWIRKGMYTQLHAFEGIGLSLPAGNKETFYGTLASTENRDITLTHTAGVGEGENMIGNSWTAPIQIANFETTDFGTATATVYVHNTGRDEQGNGGVENGHAGYGDENSETPGQWITVPIATAKTGGYTGLKVIPAMQAFQVNTSESTTLTLDYDRLVRKDVASLDNLTTPMRAPRRAMAKSQNNEIEAMMRVRLQGEKTHTDVWLQQDPQFSEEFDNGWEAIYAKCDNRSAQFYALSPLGQMAFIALPDLDGTILGMAPSRNGNDYTFTFYYIGNEEFYLNDIKTQQSTLIDAESSYSFTFEEGDTNRFFISRTPFDAPEIATGVTDLDAEAPKVQKIIYNDKLYIIRGGKVFSADGQLVK